MNLLFAILGIIGGLCTATGDMLLDLKGKGNEKLGTSLMCLVVVISIR